MVGRWRFVGGWLNVGCCVGVLWMLDFASFLLLLSLFTLSLPSFFHSFCSFFTLLLSFSFSSYLLPFALSSLIPRRFWTFCAVASVMMG